MATTTNYSWTTPDDTALVKDGAAAIRSLGTAIDSTVFTNAGAAIAKTIVDAKGDIIAATAADTVSRLAVGANDTVLTADSSAATGLKWAAPVSGGMTLLNSGGTALSGSSVTINVTTTGYVALKIYIQNAFASVDTVAGLRINGDTASNYSQSFIRPALVNFASQDYYRICEGMGTSSSTLTNTNIEIDILNPTFTDQMQIWHAASNGPSGDMRFSTGKGVYDCSAAITSIGLIMISGNFSGGTAYVYGVK
jgi:hypothetical protein